MELLEHASKVYNEHFSQETNFERALFFSWYCSIRDCTFCYMSTQPKTLQRKEARRTTASMLAETLIIKHLGWDFGFFSGGINAFTSDAFYDVLQKIHTVLGEKIWINIGATSKTNLEKYKPYIKGVVGSIETVNEELHKRICPSKPMKPYLKMFEAAQELGIRRGMTFICGLGETKEDWGKLAEMITQYGITKVHLYALNPVKGTMYEWQAPPTAIYQAWWIAQLRITFPTLDIQCGIWKDKTKRIPLLLKAGANSVSKIPVIKMFGGVEAKNIEDYCREAGRTFKSSLTILPEINWDAEVDSLPFEENLKEDIRNKLHKYLKTMRKTKLPIIHT